MHVVDNMGRGGMQNGIVNVIRHLDQSRFEHVICSIRRLDHVDAHRFPEDNVKMMCVAGEGRESRVQIPALSRSIRAVKPDIVHSRNWSGVEAVISGRWVGSCTLIHSEHGVDSETAEREPWRRVCFRRLAFGLADHVFCVSNQLRQLHARRTGFPERKIGVIHNGVDMDRFSPDSSARAAVRQEFGIAPDELCIGCVGNLTPVKDYPTLLHALNEIASVCANWRLVVAGEGLELPRLQSFVDAHPQWKDRVHFVGLSNRVREILNAMDIYVLSSVTEGISNSLLEAMATGIAVVVTETGGNPEVVVNGRSGLLFPVGDSHRLADHLLRLNAQPEERRSLAQEARQRISERFSLQSMVRRYEQLYESLVPGAKPRPHAVAIV
jgi:sugar transferase (PEP-CTERM/EpsH1 system associated)